MKTERSKNPSPAIRRRRTRPITNLWTIVLAAAAVTRALPAQADVATDPLVVLRESNDPIELELARRRLRTNPQPTIAELTQLLDAPREITRLAAVEAIVARGAVPDAPRRLAISDPSPSVRAALTPTLADPALAALVAPGVDLLVARAAFVELTWRDEVDVSVLASGLRRSEPEFLRLVGRTLVERTWPWPTQMLGALPPDGPAVEAVVAALVPRPRADAVDWLEALAQAHTGDDGLAVRVAIYAAFPAGALDLDRARELVDAGARGVGTYTDLLDAADRLAPEVADALVGDVHRLAVQRERFDLALDVLRRASPRGLRHLASLARVASPQLQAAIIEEIARRAPDLVDELVRDALEEQSPSRMEPYLLRRTAHLLDEPRWREVLLERLRQGSAEQRVAAFDALVQYGRSYDPAMLEHALAAAEADDLRTRTSALFGLAPGVLPVDVWRGLLRYEDARVRLRAMHAIPSGSPEQIAALSADLAQWVDATVEPSMRVPALRVLAQCGDPEVVTNVWRAAPVDDRRAAVIVFRDRNEAWVTSLLAEDPARDSIEFAFTRLCRGDVTVLDDLLAAPETWPATWLRRASEEIARALRSTDLDRLAELAIPGDERIEGLRARIVEWLGQRPDLPSGTLLERLYASESDPLHREQILERLVARPVGARFRAELDAALGGPLDEAMQQLCYIVVSAMQPPLDREQARLMARIVLMQGLSDPRAEIDRVLDSDAGDVAAGRVLLRMAMQSLRLPTRRDGVDAAAAGAGDLHGTAHVDPLPAGVASVFERVVDEVLRSPRLHALTRARVGGILTEFAREQATRDRLAPAVARLLLSLPDTDPTFVGPAELVLGEAAAAAGRWRDAARHYERASIGLCAAQPLPTVLRAFLPSPDPGSGIVPSARLAAAQWSCRALASRDAGDLDAAREYAARAALLARGDESADIATRTVLEELQR